METSSSSSTNQIKSKTVQGAIYLTVRNIGLQAISALGFFLLSMRLSVAEIGVFGVVVEIVGILGYFSDIGLAASLIQKKDDVTTSSLRTVFLIQQILAVLGIGASVLIFIPIAHSRSYGTTEFFIFYSLCFAFFLSSLKTIPSVLLERKLSFEKLASVDILENITFYLVTIAFAFGGFGAKSYAYGTIVRSVLGLILIYRLQFWPIGFSFDTKSIKELLKFGLPFQLNSFIALAKDRLSNLVLSGILSREPFGYLTWATKISRLSISLMDSFLRILFPTLSRIQNQPEIVKKLLSKSSFVIATVSFGMLGFANFFVPILVSTIPNYFKWQPALNLLPFLSLSAAIAALTTPLNNAFSAVGKIKTNSKYMIMWLILTWLTYPFLSSHFGLNGSIAAIIIVGFSSFFVWFEANSYFQINTFADISGPFLACILGVVLAVLTPQTFIKPPVFLLSYSIILYMLKHKELKNILKNIQENRG